METSSVGASMRGRFRTVSIHPPFGDCISRPVLTVTQIAASRGTTYLSPGTNFLAHIVATLPGSEFVQYAAFRH